ncbi:MAG: hypothetical protein JWO42_451, partial [Chloroflexi bacterium]|nr:hypothetical protein [Chloroflexota bacterium]
MSLTDFGKTWIRSEADEMTMRIREVRREVERAEDFFGSASLAAFIGDMCYMVKYR